MTRLIPFEVEKETAKFTPIRLSIDDTGTGLPSLLQMPNERNAGSPAPFLVAFTLYSALVAGTGGVYTNTNVPLIRNWTNRTAVVLRDSDVAEEPTSSFALSFAEQVREVRDNFGLKMSEVAQIFGVSRQAAYGWLDGRIRTPKPEIASKLHRLCLVSQDLKNSGIVMEHFIHRPLTQEGASLYDLLANDSELTEAIAVIKRTAEVEKNLRAESLTRHSGAPNVDTRSLSEISVPIFENTKG